MILIFYYLINLNNVNNTNVSGPQSSYHLVKYINNYILLVIYDLDSKALKCFLKNKVVFNSINSNYPTPCLDSKNS